MVFHSLLGGVGAILCCVFFTNAITSIRWDITWYNPYNYLQLHTHVTTPKYNIHIQYRPPVVTQPIDQWYPFHPRVLWSCPTCRPSRVSWSASPLPCFVFALDPTWSHGVIEDHWEVNGNPWAVNGHSNGTIIYKSDSFDSFQETMFDLDMGYFPTNDAWIRESTCDWTNYCQISCYPNVLGEISINIHIFMQVGNTQTLLFFNQIDSFHFCS